MKRFKQSRSFYQRRGESSDSPKGEPKGSPLRFGLLLTFAVAATLFALVPSIAEGTVPKLINFQGILRDGSGNPVADGSYSVTFRIYEVPTGGTLLWAETTSVTTADGLFAILLGASNPVPDTVFKGSDRWLGIAVSPDGEMPTRQQLVSVGYAYRVNSVDSASGGTITSKVSIGPGHTNTGVNAFVAGANNTASGDGATVTGIQNAASGFYATVSGGVDTASGIGTTVSGGTQNKATSDLATVGGGSENTASAERATVGGGQRNSASDLGATVGGGYGDTASGFSSTVGGGYTNTASGWVATVGGGEVNTAADSGANVSGGRQNSATGEGSTVSGGRGNIASFTYGAIGGGNNNAAGSNNSTVGGGGDNFSSGSYSTVSGGRWNRARGQYSFVGGGGGGAEADSNAAIGNWSTVGGGQSNRATDFWATVGGGVFNVAGASLTTIGGGTSNTASAQRSTIAGGESNTTSNLFATVGGGQSGTASGRWATIGGGNINVASDTASTVGGGRGDTASGAYATVPGGRGNTAAGRYSLAAGRRAKAIHAGAFVWADSNNLDFSSSADAEFNVRASGGTRIYSNSALTAGVTLAAGASAWVAVSDSILKRNIRVLDGKEMLEKVLQLPIKRWSYKAQDASIEHIGPMAQDFYPLFQVGDDEKTISTIDPPGIALAAIQGLYKMLEEQKAENEELRGELRELRELVQKLLAQDRGESTQTLTSTR